LPTSDLDPEKQRNKKQNPLPSIHQLFFVVFIL